MLPAKDLQWKKGRSVSSLVCNVKDGMLLMASDFQVFLKEFIVTKLFFLGRSMEEKAGLAII